MYTIFEIAKNFQEREHGIFIEKIQRLCWYAYSWYILSNNSPDQKNLDTLFDGQAQAGVDGPIFKKLYEDIQFNNSEKLNKAKDITNIKVIEYLDQIWKVYGRLTLFQLNHLTKQEKPWVNARAGLQSNDTILRKINNYDIFEEYSNES